MERKNDGCIFCDFEMIKENVVFSDDLCAVVLDRFPSDKGHMLVISNKHHDNILETPDETMQHMFKIAKRFGSLAMDRLAPDGMTILTNIGRAGGQQIMHVHIHIIPKYNKKDSDYNFEEHREISKELRDTLLNILK